MKIYTVCTLPKFHPNHVYRLHKQLSMNYTGDIEMFVYTDRPELFNDTVCVIPIQHSLCERQWYKIDFFGPDIVSGNEPVIVMDLDWTILKNIDHIIDTQVGPNEFISYERWWRSPNNNVSLCGGFYKFNPNECHKIWETFYTDPLHWQSKYKNPNHPFSVQGEQNFVWEHASTYMKVVTLVGYKFGRTMNLEQGNEELLRIYDERYFNKYNIPYRINGSWNPKILMVHG